MINVVAFVGEMTRAKKGRSGDMAEDFAKRIKNVMSLKVPDEVKNGIWNKDKDKKNPKTYPHILKDKKYNFLGGDFPLLCDIKGDLSKGKLIQYNGAEHLNSSQAMCINYFKKFFEKDEYEKRLLVILEECGIENVSGGNIVNAVFEYEPVKKEKTNFDFYLELSLGKTVKIISFEIKYTESEFGTIKSGEKAAEVYKEKWNNIYEVMVDESPYIKVDRDAFFQNFQINRNIVYAHKEDAVVFITPEANKSKGIEAGRKYIKELNNANVLNLYWEDLIEVTLKVVANDADLSGYYTGFYDKYISILNEYL